MDECGPGNPGGLSVEQIQALRRGGAVDGRWLYPYSETVFPRGMRAPTFMWEGPDAQGLLLRITSSNFTYEGCIRPTSTGQYLLPQDLWGNMGQQSLGELDPFRVELTWLSGGAAHGPIQINLVVARATVKG